jgi:hypothetical protein
VEKSRFPNGIRRAAPVTNDEVAPSRDHVVKRAWKHQRSQRPESRADIHECNEPGYCAENALAQIQFMGSRGAGHRR